jgi:DNA-binding MarR family transcriptional regulator/N-acetylglutamate synthase-like GNAT family acetyltransferase
VREFNRFYTRHLGLLDQAHLDSAFSLAGARVLYELAHWSETHSEPATATALARELELDAGYLSRTLADFQRRRLIKRSTAREDARQSHLTLTAAGRATFADLDARAHRAVADVLAPVSNTPAVISAMRTVLRALDPSTRGEPSDIVLRDPRPGDYGWIVMRHGELYAQEYGWDIRFEILVSRIVADFAASFDPRRERCWIAERDGERVGTVSLMAHPERRKVAKLRLLLVEPSARGLGVGRTLVDACATFARAAGYDTITLWTNSVLVSARRIYQAAGYRLVDEAPHSMFGSDLVGQTWELKL